MMTRTAEQKEPHVMTEREVLVSKLRLKRQAVKLIRGEIRNLKTRLFLLELREQLTARIDRDPDRELSSQVDCLTFLLESMERPR